MKGKRYSTEQKIRILRQADQAGVHIIDVCREHGISEQCFHRWKRGFALAAEAEGGGGTDESSASRAWLPEGDAFALG